MKIVSKQMKARCNQNNMKAITRDGKTYNRQIKERTDEFSFASHTYYNSTFDISL